MSSSESEKVVSGRARRMSIGGKLSFRRRVPNLDAEGLPVVDGADDPPHLDELVPEGFDEVEIEVGPGKGTFVCAAVQARPESFVLGIEASPGYATYAAAQLKELDVDNGLFLIDNASLFLQDRVEPESLDRLHVYFPDPWPKRRHRNRRFFTEDAPKIVHRVLKPDGLLLVATDNAGYAGQIARVLGSSPLLERDLDAERELPALGPGHAFGPTNFERKYIKEGRVIRRFAFRKVD